MKNELTFPEDFPSLARLMFRFRFFRAVICIATVVVITNVV
jgi:hypothetical protein